MQPEDLNFYLVKKARGKWHIRHPYAMCESTPEYMRHSAKTGPYRLELSQSLAEDDLVFVRLSDGVNVTDLHHTICVRCKRNFLNGVRAKLQLEQHKKRIQEQSGSQ